jgi:hypothetical protein
VISKRGTKFFSVERQSPLEAFQAVKYLREASLTMLDTSMAFLLRHQIAPQHALETATKIAVEILHPILGKIDPYDLGAFDLDSSLSKDYCRRICSPVDKQKRTQRSADYKALVETYPAHEFGIDREEARVLGLNVCEPSEVLDDVFEELRQHLDKVNSFIGLIDRDKENTHEKVTTESSQATAENQES